MATKAKEIVRLKTNSKSAPTTPSSDDKHAASTQEKPMPNYLRPTISSCQNSAKNQHPESPSLTAKKPRDKAPSPSSQSPSKDKTQKIKSPLSKPSISPKTSPKKSSKAIKSKKAPTLANSKCISKGIASGVTEKKEAKSPTQKERVLSEESINISSPHLKRELKGHDNEEKKEEEEEILLEVISKDSMESRANGEKFMLADSRNEGEGRKPKEANVALKKEEAKGKGSPTADNAVIEETASKLAEKRNKVKALAGAFETVISLQKPDGQQSPQKGEEAKGGRGSQYGQHKEEEKDVYGGKIGQESQQEVTGQHDQHKEELVHISEIGQNSQPEVIGQQSINKEPTKDGIENKQKINQDSEEQQENIDEEPIKDGIENKHNIDQHSEKNEKVQGGLTKSSENSENVKGLSESTKEGSNAVEESTNENESSGTEGMTGSAEEKDTYPREGDPAV